MVRSLYFSKLLQHRTGANSKSSLIFYLILTAVATCGCCLLLSACRATLTWFWKEGWFSELSTFNGIDFEGLSVPNHRLLSTGFSLYNTKKLFS